MTRLISSELLKLRSTRTAVALIASVVGLVVLIGLIATLTADFEQEEVQTVDLLGIAGFAQVFALILGILAVTTEFRHGTITPTLVVAPDRVRLVLAKLVAHALAGLVLGVLAVGLTTAIVLVGLGPFRMLERALNRMGGQAGVLELELPGDQPVAPLLEVVKARRVRVGNLEFEAETDRRRLRLGVDLPMGLSERALVEELSRRDDVLAARWTD
jgi:hypothetical protein